MTQSKALKRLMRKFTIETLWIYIARILLDSKPLRAYEIKKKLQDVFNINPPAITVYTVVYRMHREDLLDVVKSDGETMYKLSEKGKEELHKALEFIEYLMNKLRF